MTWFRYPRAARGPILLAVALLAATLLFVPQASAQPVPASGSGDKLELSPALLELLRAEMLEIAKGVQVIPLAIASGDWQTVADTSARIRASYILEQRLTADQIHELETALPDGFKRIDADFHRRADRLSDAARAHDAEMAAFHYARMLETCAACHAEYAPARFPGFSPVPDSAPPAGHHHE